MWHVAALHVLDFCDSISRTRMFYVSKPFCAICDQWVYLNVLKDSAVTTPRNFSFWVRQAQRSGRVHCRAGLVKRIAQSLRPHYVISRCMPWMQRAERMPLTLVALIYPEAVVFHVEWAGVFQNGHRALAQLKGWAIQRHTYFRMRMNAPFERLFKIFCNRAHLPRQWVVFREAKTQQVIQERDTLWTAKVPYGPPRETPALFASIELGANERLVRICPYRRDNGDVTINDKNLMDEDNDLMDDDDDDDDDNALSDDDEEEYSPKRYDHQYDLCQYGFHRASPRARTVPCAADPGRPLQPTTGWLLRRRLDDDRSAVDHNKPFVFAPQESKEHLRLRQVLVPEFTPHRKIVEGAFKRLVAYGLGPVRCAPKFGKVIMHEELSCLLVYGIHPL